MCNAPLCTVRPLRKDEHAQPIQAIRRITLNGAGSVGKRRRYPVRLPSPAHPRNEIDAVALRTFASSGFGDTAIGRAQPHSVLDSIELYHQARIYRSYKLREIVKAMLQAVVDFVRPIVARWKRQQHARATYLALRALDSHTLRDLGFHRSELMSVAAEVAGRAETTRVRLGRRF